MARAGSPKRHYVVERNAKETACHKIIKGNLTITVTVDPERVTCLNCQNNMEKK